MYIHRGPKNLRAFLKLYNSWWHRKTVCTSKC